MGVGRNFPERGYSTYTGLEVQASLESLRRGVCVWMDGSKKRSSRMDDETGGGGGQLARAS